MDFWKNMGLAQKHNHMHHELYFLLSGSGTKYFVNDEILYVHQNETVFIKSGYIHKTAYTDDAQRLLISFTSEFLGEEYLELLGELGNKKLFCPDKRVHRLFMELFEEYTAKEEYYLQQCQSLLRQLIIALLRSESAYLKEGLSGNEAIIQDAAKYISENLTEDFSLKKLSEKYAMSESHFSRTFKQYTGLGVTKYIKLTRLRKAEKLLESGEYSVSQAAMECGFNNSNYFISEFKKYKGTTPLKYSRK